MPTTKTMNKFFLDTAFVIAMVNERDLFFERANELLPLYITEQLVTTDAVLLEIGNSLAKGHRKKAAEIIDILRSSDKTEVVEVSADLLDRALAMYRQYEDKTWGLVDCISFIVMREHGITDALTHDRHFQQAGFRALMREPVN